LYIGVHFYIAVLMFAQALVMQGVVTYSWISLVLCAVTIVTWFVCFGDGWLGVVVGVGEELDVRQSERMDKTVSDEELRDIVKVDDMGRGGTETYSFCRVIDDLQIRGDALVEALRYELEGHGFSSSRVYF
jgi:hypothetical protein